MPYHLEGRLLEVCNCRVLCPCWIGEDPDYGTCDTIIAWRFDKGTINGVDVAGRTIAVIAHVPGNILQGNWRAAVYLDDKVTPQQEEAILGVYTGKLGGPVAELVKLIGEVVSVEKVPITFTVEGGRGTIKLGDAGYAELEPYTERERRDDDAHRHRLLDGARRARVRRQVAALPREEREARHRPRHLGPQRAAEHVPVRRLTSVERTPGTAAAGGALVAPLPGRRALFWALLVLARDRVVGDARAVEREPVRALPRARRLGRRGRARRALPRHPAGRRSLVPAVLHAAAWVLMIAAMMLPTTFPLLAMFRRITGERPDAGRLVGAGRARLLRRLVRVRRRRPSRRCRTCSALPPAPPGSSPTAGSSAPRACRRRALPVERAQVPLPRSVPHAVHLRRRALARARAGARGIPDRARPRPLLRRLLLGADARHVRRRPRQRRLDARAGGGHGGREEPAVGTAPAHAARDRPRRLGRRRRARPRLVARRAGCRSAATPGARRRHFS